MSPTRRSFVKNMSLLGTFPFVRVESLNKLDEIITGAGNEDFPKLIHAPEDPAEWPGFRKKLIEWRKEKKKQINYNEASYTDPSFTWAATNYACCFLMMYDLDFYDPLQGKYSVDKIIEKGKREFGGYDSVVLWHAYPRIGIDERNQYDFYRDMPGGLPGVRKVIDDFHVANIKIFVNYNPWDTSTRREGRNDVDSLAEMIGAINADGIFLDTMKEVENVYRRKLNAVKPGIVLEGESPADIENIPANHLSWAQWFSDRYVPGILRNKWFERRHMQHQIARWDRDHTTELHQAWMNGSGMMIWENVFGQWLGWSERDKSIIRSMLPLQRRYHHLFNGEGWIPLVDTLQEGVFASLWEGNGLKLWTLVNRNEFEVTGYLLNPGNNSTEEKCYDLVQGNEIKSNPLLSGTISARSIGCIIRGKKTLFSDDFDQFLMSQNDLYKEYNGNDAFPFLIPTLKKIKQIPGKKSALPPDMVELKPYTFNQHVEMLVREAGDYKSAMDIDVSHQLNAPYFMLRTVHIPHMAIDKYPVTNQQYADFIKVTGYSPKEKYLFLRHWKNGKPPAGKENHPVVYVDLDDARAFAGWMDKRLPTEAEWQFAAQGYDQHRYPFGNELKEGTYNNTNDTTAVNTYPSGVSPFGCYDMCGNTWELTESEYADKHNRFCILKGGSYYHAKDSMWYTSGGPVPSALATKFLMMYPGLDRCSTIGFRCAMDL